MFISAAHGDAYKLAHIIHREINEVNITIDQDGNGYLNDWDLARKFCKERPLQPDRSVSLIVTACNGTFG